MHLALNTVKLTRSLLIAGVLSASASSFGAAVHMAGIADFYQHQKSSQGTYPGTDPFKTDPLPAPLKPAYDNKNWWENDGGWCLTTAWTDTLYYWSQKNAPNLFDHTAMGAEHKGKSWLDRFNYMNEDLAIIAGARFGGTVPTTTGGACANDADVRTYASKYGYTATIDTYQYQAGSGRIGKFPDGAASGTLLPAATTMLDIMNTALGAGKTVVMIMEGTVAGAWWSGSFHAVALEGIDGSKLYYADPNNTPAGANWGVPYKDTDKLPVGADASFDNSTLKADGRTWDGGTFNGSALTELYVMSVPTPGTILLSGMGGFLALRRRR